MVHLSRYLLRTWYLGLYYITKGVKALLSILLLVKVKPIYSEEEVTIAFNEGKLDLHAKIKVRWTRRCWEMHASSTLLWSCIVQRVVPKEVGFINQVLTKKALRDIIGDILKHVGIARTAQFLDDIKDLGYYWAFKGGLSFKLTDVIIPPEKDKLVNAKLQES
jgi:DNA-directed RNA polymerase subunit beta'